MADMMSSYSFTHPEIFPSHKFLNNFKSNKIILLDNLSLGGSHSKPTHSHVEKFSK